MSALRLSVFLPIPLPLCCVALGPRTKELGMSLTFKQTRRALSRTETHRRCARAVDGLSQSCAACSGYLDPAGVSGTAQANSIGSSRSRCAGQGSRARSRLRWKPGSADALTAASQIWAASSSLIHWAAYTTTTRAPAVMPRAPASATRNPSPSGCRATASSDLDAWVPAISGARPRWSTPRSIQP